MSVKNYVAVLILTLLASCSANKIFLQPTKIPVAIKKATLKTDKDTTVVFFTGDNHQPTFTNKGKDTLDLGYTIESVVFKSSNGNDLNGWFLKPKNQTAKITLLHFHGNGGSVFQQYQAISPLLKYGFQIFMFDYSGFGFSAGKATRENVLIDGLSALDYLKARQDTKDSKLIIYGQSLGGHLAAVVAKQREKDIDALVIEGGFSSHKDIAKSRGGFFGKLIVKEMYSGKAAIKDFHKPVLVIHSSEDKTVPFALGKKMFDNANQPKEFYEIKHCHICGPQFYADTISQKIKGLLRP